MFERDPIYARGIQLEVTRDGKSQIYDVADEVLCRDLNDAPLSQHAWVLQERLLERASGSLTAEHVLFNLERNLYDGFEMMHFEICHKNPKQGY